MPHARRGGADGSVILPVLGVAKAQWQSSLGSPGGGSKPGRYVKVRPDQVQAIMELVRRGEKITKVARITGLSRPTVYRVLRNQKRRPRGEPK